MTKDELLNELAADWQSSSIDSGDVVLLHSSTSRLARRVRKEHGIKLEAGDILDSFLRAVGPAGTLLLPLFNFGFTCGQPFDIRETRSEMGAVTEAARLRDGAVRTGHPIYSFAAVGARAGEFRGVDNFSAFGIDSPFGMLHRMNGKIAILDLDEVNSMTFHHHVEELEEVKYRFQKTFTGPYTDWDGRTEERSYAMYVRDIDNGVQSPPVNKMSVHLWAQGYYRGNAEGIGNGLRVIEAKTLYTSTRDIIRAGRADGMLYTVEKT